MSGCSSPFYWFFGLLRCFDAMIFMVSFQNPSAQCILGHSDIVWAVSFHSSDNRLLSASADGTIKMWEPGESLISSFFISYSVRAVSIIFSQRFDKSGGISDEKWAFETEICRKLRRAPPAHLLSSWRRRSAYVHRLLVHGAPAAARRVRQAETGIFWFFLLSRIF